MNDNQQPSVNVGNEKIGIGMIASSLVVIVITVAVFLYQQKHEDMREIQRQGTGLVRLLGSMSVDQLKGHGSSVGMLRVLKETLANRHFAFAAVVNVDGMSLAEYRAPDVIVPPMVIPRLPSQWTGERESASAEGIKINEYFAPVMHQGELQAFVRLGYQEPGYSLDTSQVRLLAIMSMAIFMLTPIFYFLIKKEIKPLTSISSQLQALIKKTESTEPDVASNSNTKDFMKQFSTVVEAAYKHIDALEAKQTNSVVSSKLLVYQKVRLESALNALPYAILVADESGQVTYTSNKIHKQLGTQQGEVLGCNLADFCENREITEYLVSCHASSALRAYQNEEVDVYLPETDKRLSICAFPLFSQKHDNQLLGTVIVFRDITHEGVEQQNNGEFIAHVAHELKAPLNVLYMYSETLLDHADASRELTIEAANIIHDETERISQMIDNLLNLTMIEMGTVAMRRQRVKVADFLEDIYQTMSRNKLVETMEFDLKLDHDLGTVQLDKNLVRVCINNLISNSIKYNKPGGRIELIAEQDDSEIIIGVRDTGIGISAEDQQRIFSKFFRSDDDEVRKRTGHGLGLSLVNEIVKLHHGKIQLNSSPGQGTEFLISFKKENNMLKDAI
ncbi:MAG: PAS domain-containing sensor histidine kinase [Gammaproteobacteria bacterium]|nr:PAS domain-containing sensor histidine kinase [Gammaproteobacteria bacterium]